MVDGGIRGHRVVVKVARFPDGIKDVDQLLRERGPAAYERMIAEATPGPVWAIDYACEQEGVETPEQAQAVADALVEYLSTLAPVRRSRYVSMLAERLAVPEQAIRQTLNEAWKRLNIQPAQDEAETPPTLGFSLPEVE